MGIARNSRQRGHHSGLKGSQLKKAKVGRPKLPKGTTKRRIVPVRFTTDDLKAMAAAAKIKNQSVSEWIRGTISATLND